MSGTANMLDLSILPPVARREVRDFYQFLLLRRKPLKKDPVTVTDERRFSDLCGTLSWKGDAVSEQRKLRDEW